MRSLTRFRCELKNNDGIEQVWRNMAALRNKLKVVHRDHVTDQSDIVQSKATMTPADVRAIIDEAYEWIEKQMLDSQIASLLKEIVGNSKNILIFQIFRLC